MVAWPLLLVTGYTASAQDFVPARCELLPLPDRQVSFLVDGIEKTRWHFDQKYPRPFFYPLNGPSGVSLTRMGHPGAQNHDHHRSVWFAHHKVNGLDFWADGKGTQIRQEHWYRYRDGQEESLMASHLGWYGTNDQKVMDQDLVAAVRPLDSGEYLLEFQITMRPPEGAESVTLNKTNFGFLAVRVSKTLSAYFGGGQLRSSEGKTGEQELFGGRARWMDYSGPVVAGAEAERRVVTEGITFFDHPDNPRYPTHWHVREDGWMGASFGMQEEYVIDSENPLTLRYLLHVHAGGYDHDREEAIHRAFAVRPGFLIRKPGAGEKHRQFEAHRITPTPAGR